MTTQSEIEHLNNELRQRIDELQTLFDVAPIGIAVARDVDCKRIDVNPAGASILGISRERNASTSGDAQPFKVFKDGREVPNAELPMQAAATTGNQIANVEYEIHRTDGETINLLEYASPLRDERGRLRGSLGVWVDVTAYKKTEADLRKAREQAERLSRVKDEFLATLSHELRTPLTPILGWVRMIRSGNLQAAEVDRGMGIIERNVVTQTSLIEDLLDISRIIAGKLKLEPRRVVLASAADAALDAVKHSADSKNVQLKIDADRGVVVLGDHSRLQQIIWNLLTNAVKFTPRGGTVSMQIRGSDDRAVVRVTDSGEGIDADYLPHVFDRFSQFDGSTTRRHGGLGLGLSIVKHLVELHGGTVQAYSEGRGKGATFEVALTRVLDTGADVEARGLEQQLEDKRTLLKDVALLVVDDEVDTRLFLERALSLFGAKVDSAANASDAIQKFATHRFELVVSDIGMPDEDGYALLKKIRGIDRSVPVLALTAFARPQDRDRTLQEGFDHYLAKPVDPTELATMIAGLLLRKRQAKA